MLIVMYTKDEEELIVIVAAQKVETGERKEMIYDLFVPSSASPTPRK
jgi:hypothetical protein